MRLTLNIIYASLVMAGQCLISSCFALSDWTEDKMVWDRPSSYAPLFFKKLSASEDSPQANALKLFRQSLVECMKDDRNDGELVKCAQSRLKSPEKEQQEFLQSFEDENSASGRKLDRAINTCNTWHQQSAVWYRSSGRSELEIERTWFRCVNDNLSTHKKG